MRHIQHGAPLLLPLLLLLGGCSGEPKTGPVEPAWDREACAHCQMTVGDRHFAAHVRLVGGKVRHFDDPGCAASWLAGRADSEPEPAEIWVRDADGDGWVEARTARFTSGHNTPMGYGYGAQPAAAGTDAEELEGAIDWPEFARQVQLRERERRGHSAD